MNATDNSSPKQTNTSNTFNLDELTTKLWALKEALRQTEGFIQDIISAAHTPNREIPTTEYLSIADALQQDVMDYKRQIIALETERARLSKS